MDPSIYLLNILINKYFEQNTIYELFYQCHGELGGKGSVETELVKCFQEFWG